MYKIEAVCYSTIGKVRNNNEDNFFFSSEIMEEKNNGTRKVLKQSFYNIENKVFAIFDGMGGEEKGERASFLAALKLKERVNEEDIIDWDEYIKETNEIICNEMHHSYRMGSTVAAIQFLDEYISLMNLGDSRIYAFVDNELKKLSKDHVEIMVDQKNKPCLTAHLGIYPEDFIICPFKKVIFYDSLTRILICSDGISDMLSDLEISNIMKNVVDTQKCCETLIDEAMKKGGIDNTTVQLFTIK